MQLEAPSFEKLPLQQQTPGHLADAGVDCHRPYHLRPELQVGAAAEAAAGGNPEASGRRESAALRKITDFTKLFWANRGNHNEMTAQKFLPEFSFEELKAAAAVALRNGGFKGLAGLDQELEALRLSLFDPKFEPMITAKSPQGSLDILQASANNFYDGLSMAELQNYHDAHPLNSRLTKNASGNLVEEVYRAGTADGKVPPGMYAPFLKKAVEYLEKARVFADPGQKEAIGELVRYYQTGDPADWIRFGIAWVQNDARVDFANGFIEVYRDPRAAKGTSQSFVSVTDEKLNQAMLKLAANAQYFEDHAPWLPQYKKQGVKPPLAKAVETLIETGDFLVTTIGDNLPNENEIREKYGSKSSMLTGSSRTLRQATGNGVLEEFSASPEEIALSKKYGEEAADMMTALHEVIGHGSGKLSPRLKGGSEAHLKQYFSTLEEARADLMALWNIFDPKLQKLGLVSSPEVGKAMYYNAVRTVLTQLMRNPQGRHH